MKQKAVFLVLYLMALAILYGCCSSSGNGVFINPAGDSVITSREVIIDDLGRLPAVTFPSGARIEGPEENTLTPGIVVSIVEQKINGHTTAYFGNSEHIGVCLYKITAFMNPTNSVGAKTYVTTTEKPLKITLPKPQNSDGIILAGIKESDTDPWRLFNFSDSDELLANITGAKAAGTNVKDNTFSLFRLGTQFALLSYGGNTGDKLPDSYITSLTASSSSSIQIEDWKYQEDLRIKGLLKGVKLDSIKPTDLRARITYRNNQADEANLKVNGANVLQTTRADKTVPGYSHQHSFVVDSVADSTMMGINGEFDFTLNLSGVETTNFPLGFLIEFYNRVDSEKVLPYNYTEFYTVNPKEGLKPTITSVGRNSDGLYELNPAFLIHIDTEMTDSERQKIESAVSVSEIEPDKVIKTWNDGNLTISFAQELESDTTYTLSFADVTDIEKFYINNVEDITFRTTGPKPAETFTLTLNKGAGIASVTGDGSYVEGAAVTASCTMLNGYEFVSWSGDFTTETFTMPANNATMTANARPVSYTISYSLNGGQTASVNPTSYDITSATITLSNPSKDGYTFIGWSGTDLTGSDTTEVTILTNSTGNREYTANWSLNLSFVIASNTGCIIDEDKELYYSLASFTVTPVVADAVVLTDSEKSDVLSAIFMKDAGNNILGDDILQKNWQDGKIALNFTKDLNASSTYTIFCDNVPGISLSSTASLTFKTFYYKGRGTEEIPFQVENAPQLDLVKNYLNYCFKQITDINIDSFNNWSPIGDDINKFTGTYDGNTKKISNLKINTDQQLQYTGIFGYNAGKIRKILVEGFSITGGNNSTPINCDYSGVIVGYNTGEITECSVTGNYTEGSIVFGNKCVGGICAQNEGNIVNCQITNSTVQGSGNFEYCDVGAICGNSSNGIISFCHVASSTIQASGNPNYCDVGGICGSSSNISITSCNVASSTVQGTGNSEYCDVGGICGYIYGSSINSCQVEKSNIYNSGDSTYLEVGVICGRINSGSISSCYVDNSNIQASGDTKTIQIGGICGYDIASNITSCHITTTNLQGSGNSESISMGGICSNIQSGTLSNCYVYDSEFQANQVESQYVYIGGICGNNYGNVTSCNIKHSRIVGPLCYMVGGICAWFENTNSVLKSCYVENCEFEGKTLTGGICACVNTSTVSDCYIIDSTIKGNGSTGSICGSIQNVSNISNCYADNSNVQGNSYTGGICGRIISNGGSISNSYVASSTIAGNVYTGGICGRLYSDDSISNSYIYKSTVQCLENSNNSYTGGISAWIDSNVKVSSCKVDSSFVNGGYYVGGICSIITTASIYNCYVKDTTIDSNGYVGGIGSYLQSNASIYDCYVASSTVKNGNYAGGICCVITNNGGSITSSYVHDSTVEGSSYKGYIVGYLGTGNIVSNNFTDSTGAITGAGSFTNCYNAVTDFTNFISKVWSDEVWKNYNISETSWPPDLKALPRQ